MVVNKKVKVYETLRHLIIDGELEPGLPINEADFARELSVSKTPVREALRQLERDGLVENVPGRGSAISHIKPQDIREVFEIREIIEVAAAKRAARQHGDDELRRERDSCLQMLKEGKTSQETVHEWGSWEDVHLSIVKSLGNQMLVDMYLGLLDRIHRIRSYYGQRFTQRRLCEILVEHAAVLEAIVEGNAERAEHAVQDHLSNAGSFLTGLEGPGK
ncbi:MAG TPA: GntR family transcriptional regulator [Spirochaetia bacterium]|nr:GntR family transcriptional regulator [Spirochaetia bacterium]